MQDQHTTHARSASTIPAGLRHEAAILRRDLAAAVDVIVPLLAKITPLGNHVVDIAETIDGVDDMTMASSETYLEVSRQAGLDELDRTVQRLLAALQAHNPACCVGDLEVVKVS